MYLVGKFNLVASDGLIGAAGRVVVWVDRSTGLVNRSWMSKLTSVRGIGTGKRITV